MWVKWAWQFYRWKVQNASNSDHVNMSWPQDLSKGKQLNDIQPPGVGGEEITLLVEQMYLKPRYTRKLALVEQENHVLFVLFLGGPLWVCLMATLEANLTK